MRAPHVSPSNLANRGVGGPPKPTGSASASRPGPKKHSLDTPIKDVLEPLPAHCDGKFTAREAARNFGIGMGNSFLTVLHAFRDHPIRSNAILTANLALWWYVPEIAHVVGYVALAYAAFKVCKGLFKAVKFYVKGDPDAAERACQYIGHGVSDVVLKKLGGKGVSVAQMPGKVHSAVKDVKAARTKAPAH